MLVVAGCEGLVVGHTRVCVEGTIAAAPPIHILSAIVIVALLVLVTGLDLWVRWAASTTVPGGLRSHSPTFIFELHYRLLISIKVLCVDLSRLGRSLFVAHSILRAPLLHHDVVGAQMFYLLYAWDRLNINRLVTCSVKHLFLHIFELECLRNLHAMAMVL